ncbi:hypothetical protein B0H14DRAFT_3133326 [Mycena olivaceomarginata]|nr:hypothetical protein B0H14DRAFT_3133326 [Mycena olivaceomarginata]
MNPMWHGGDRPPLVDPHPGGRMIFPAGAVIGGQPEFHAAFSGSQQQQSPPGWPRGQPPRWPNATSGPSCASTPMHQPSPWQQQHQQHPQQTPPSWAHLVMPRQSWGPAPQGMPSPWGENSGSPTPWPEQHWTQQPPPQSTPVGHPDGSTAGAAPPLQSSSGQPIGPSFVNGGGVGGGMPGMFGGPLTEPWEEDVGRAAWRAHGRDPRMEGSDPRMEGQQWANWGSSQGPNPQTVLTQESMAAYHEGAELMRTHSQGRLVTPGMTKKKEKKRANSFSGGQLPGGWGIPAKFDENHLSPRPEDWRDGYSPRGISGADISFSSLFRLGRRSGSDWTGDNKRRTLAMALAFNASRPNISYDMRRAPDETQFMGKLSSHCLIPWLISPELRMRLMHPRLPWYVDIFTGPHGPGVTLYDVIRQLFEQLNRPIAAHDFYNEEMGKRDREVLTLAFKERCAMKGEFAREEKLKGVKRVDFLGRECVFVGLVRRTGTWEIKTDSDH